METTKKCGRQIELINSARSKLRYAQTLTTNKSDAALEVCNHDLGTSVDDVALPLATITHALEAVVRKRAQRDSLVRRGRFEIEGRVGGNAYGYVAFARLKAVGSAARKLPVEENIADSVLRINLRSVYAAEFNVTFKGNVCPYKLAADVGYVDLTPFSLEVNRRINRHQKFEIDIADVGATTIVSHHVDDQGLARLSRRDAGLRRFKSGREFDFVSRPGFYDDGARQVFEFNADIFGDRISL